MRDAPARSLTDEQLLDELAYLYATRHQILRRGPAPELTAHTRRISDLEQEYLSRRPHRETDDAGEHGFGDEHAPSATDPAGTARSGLGTDERVDRPTRT